MITKWSRINLGLETHRWLEKIQDAEIDKFGFVQKRRKEQIIADVLKVGIPEFIKQNGLNVKL